MVHLEGVVWVDKEYSLGLGVIDTVTSEPKWSHRASGCYDTSEWIICIVCNYIWGIIRYLRGCKIFSYPSWFVEYFSQITASWIFVLFIKIYFSKKHCCALLIHFFLPSFLPAVTLVKNGLKLKRVVFLSVWADFLRKLDIPEKIGKRQDQKQPFFLATRKKP